MIRARVSRTVRGWIQASRHARSGVREGTAWLGRYVEISTPNDLELGPNVTVGDGARLLGRIAIGSNTTIHNHVLLDASGGSIRIGRNCSANEFCVLYGMGELTIGNDVRMATHTVIVSGNHNFDDPDRLIREQGVTVAPITIGDNVWIAANVTILAGVEIGAGSVIGAGAVVTQSIPARSVAVGVPARVIRQR